MGEITGQGEKKYPNGVIHKGFFQNGKKHGKGKTYAA